MAPEAGTDLAARSEIENLLHLYAERIDAGDFAGVGALFAEGRIAGPDGTPLAEGSQAVARLYERTTRRYEDGTPRTHHVTTNLILDLDESAGHASGRSYYTVFQALPELPLQPIVAGRYEDRFVRDDAGWRFRERRMHVLHVGDVSRHLLIELPRS